MDQDSVQIRRMKPGEEGQASQLVQEVFTEFVAPLYEKEGEDEFLRYVDPDLMTKRAQRNHFSLLAEYSGQLVGVIEVRDFNHISLLFVSGNAQQRGIAKLLLEKALKIARRNVPGLTEVTVHSSPNAVNVYEPLGFKIQGPEKIKQGIRYIPMKVILRT